MSSDFGFNIGTDKSQFFQTDRDLVNNERRKYKRGLAKELVGFPVELPTKVLDMILSPWNEGEAFVGMAGSVARKIDLKTGKTLSLYKGHTAPVTSISYFQFEDEQYLVTGSWDKSVRVYNIKTKECVKIYKEHSDFIKCVTVGYLDGEPIIYSGSSDHDIRCYKFKENSSFKVLKGHRRAVEDIKLTLDGKSLLSCGGDLLVIQWDLNTFTQRSSISSHLTTIYRLMVTEETLFTASGDKTVKRFDLETLDEDLELTHPDHVRCLCVTPDRRYLITGCRDEGVRVFDLNSDSLIGTFHGHWDEITQIVYSPSDKLIYSSGLDCTIRKWKIEECSTQPDLSDLVPTAFSKINLPFDSDLPNLKPPVMTLEEELELADLLSDEE